MALREEITDEGYRLAPLLLRISALAIDLSFMIGAIILLYFLLYPHHMFPTLGTALGMENDWSLITDYNEKSGLLVAYEEDGQSYMGTVTSDNYEDYWEALERYYLVYNVEGNPDNPHPNGYDVPWFNEHILGLPNDVDIINESKYFTWDTIDGYISNEAMGILSDDCFKTDAGGNPVLDDEGNRILRDDTKIELLNHFSNQYKLAQDHLMNEPYYKPVMDGYESKFFLVMSIVTIVPILGFFLIPPLCSSVNATLGKKFMGLGLIRADGYLLPKWKNSLRVLPLALTIEIALLLNDLAISGGFILLVFLITLTTGLLTKKRRALHDYVASSVVTRREDAFDAPLAPRKGEEEKGDA